MANEELIKALRYCPYRGCASCHACDENGRCLYYGTAGLMTNAADALEAAEQRIAELEAQIPKEGEWKVQTTVYPSITCSECGVEIPLVAGWCMDAHMNYCPNCGAKMRKGDTE